jgi:hypothetical protein
MMGSLSLEQLFLRGDAAKLRWAEVAQCRVMRRQPKSTNHLYFAPVSYSSCRAKMCRYCLTKKHSRNRKSTKDGQLTLGGGGGGTVHHLRYGKSCQRRYSTVLTFLWEYGRPDQRDGAALPRVPTWFDCCDLSDDERTVEMLYLSLLKLTGARCGTACHL